MDERRQLPRWEIKKESLVWMPQALGFSQCIIEDMHLKGMRISCEKRLFQQQVVRMSFMIGDHFDLIKIEAHLPWAMEDADRYVYGLSFSRIEDEDKDKLYNYISTHCFDQFKKKWWAKG